MRETALRQAEELRENAATQIAELRSGAQQQLGDVRRSAEEQIEDIRRNTKAEVDEATRAAEAQLSEARQALDAERERLKAASEAGAEEIVISQLTEAQAETDRRLKDAVERTRIEAQQAALSSAAHLVDAVGRLDEAGSLGEVLDTLVQCGGREVERAAVLVTKSQALKGWKMSGFDLEPVRTIGSRSLPAARRGRLVLRARLRARVDRAQA